jgi:hypothetical protein
MYLAFFISIPSPTINYVTFWVRLLDILPFLAEYLDNRTISSLASPTVQPGEGSFTFRRYKFILPQPSGECKKKKKGSA